ncbi:MAG: tRNA (guanosine(37)-N1)-methyltransferase TrmD [Lachnospiraceae bacterium]|nr:tRNA (guanosine(37)-N1)-methyltransferase TrmD [Lachnospiraceae bacterium]
MNFHILTLFPEMIEAGLSASIIGRAVKTGLLSIQAINIRDFTNEKHGHVDDTPYGGGAGMVMQCQPIYDAFAYVEDRIRDRVAAEILSGRKPSDMTLDEVRPRVIYTSPAGKVFDQDMAKELSGEEDLIILCGHYEGVDERVLSIMNAEHVSIGDYVLTGGELPAMVMVDAISRMIPGVLNNEASAADESFSGVRPKEEFTKKARKEVYGELALPQAKDEIRLLEYPQYTRPEEFMGMKVPEVLLSGDHAKIEQWRRKQSLERTRKQRPDLLQ